MPESLTRQVDKFHQPIRTYTYRCRSAGYPAGFQLLSPRPPRFMRITGINYPPMPTAAANDELIPPTDQAIAIHDYHLNAEPRRPRCTGIIRHQITTTPASGPPRRRGPGQAERPAWLNPFTGDSWRRRSPGLAANASGACGTGSA